MRPHTAFLPTPGVWRRPRLRHYAHLPFSKWTCSTIDPSVAFVLSHFEASALLSLKKHAEPSPVIAHGPFSIDVGMRTLDDLVILPDGIGIHSSTSSTPPPVIATWPELKKMSKKGRSGAFECYMDGLVAPSKIAGISDATQRTASLYPCVPRKPPTMVLAGFGMHRLKDTDPSADTEAKIRAVGKSFLRGEVLDVCTGLGYTAIAAAEAPDVTAVMTIELDPVVVSIQKRNPWSQALFLSEKIRRVEGDATVVLRELPDERFSVVIHDPPAQAMGGELYSREFYEELRRVCKVGSRLFHYIGDPASQESGRLYRGVMNRLKEAGFRDLKKDVEAYGVTGCAG